MEETPIQGNIFNTFINTFDSVFSTVCDFAFHASNCLASAVGMSNFTLATPVFLSIMAWCCFFMPPFAVLFGSYRRDEKTFTLNALYNVILCFFLWVPGVLHALWFCFSETMLQILFQRNRVRAGTF